MKLKTTNLKNSLLTIIAIFSLALTLTLTGCNFKSNDTNNGDNNATTNGNSKTEELELKVSDFFPLEKDVYMKFKGTGNEYAEYETYVEFVNDNVMQIRNVNPGTSLAVVYEIKDGELLKNFSKGEVYYRYDFTDMKEDNVEVLIKEPIKIGTSWTLKDGTKRSITSLNKTISTAASDYTALEITSEYKDSIVTDYYVKGLGHVKKVFKSKDSDFTVISELEKLEKNTPYKEKINVFYPDFNNDKLVPVEKEFDLTTNQDTISFIEKELKNPSENKDLSKVISDNTKILDVKFDVSTKDSVDIVVVDFSPELVTEMNAGSSLESMILNSIAKTFGDYYQVKGVQITLEGKLYESGHILLEKGEYFHVDM